MKKFFLFTILAVCFSVIVWAGNPTGGVATFSVRTNTSILAQITTAPTSIDSLFVCYIRTLGAADTIFVAKLDSTDAVELIADIDPGLVASFFLLTRGSGGKTAVSAKTALTVYGPEIGINPDTNALSNTEKLLRAVSWRPVTILDEFTVNGATGADSTGHYKGRKAMSIMVKATQAGDSVKFMLYTFYGQRNMTQTGTTIGFTSSIDSLNITGPTTQDDIFAKTLTLDLAAPVVYWKLQGYTGNGKNTAVEMYYSWDKN